MEPGLQRRVQRYGWDKASAYYEVFWQDQLKPAQDLLLEMAELKPGEMVLDVACGTGLVSFNALAKLGEGGRVLGTDISEKMVQMANSLALRKNESRAKFEWMDAEDLQLENNSFDAVLCSLGLMYVPDPRKALQEMNRVLKPGGRAVAAVWGQRKKCGWAEIFEIVDQHVASEVCPMFFNLGNPDMLELHFKVSGFTDIKVQRISTILLYKDDREALGAAFDGGPVALAYHKFSESIKQEVHEAYLSSLNPFKRGEGYEVPGEFVLAKGIRRGHP
jgi:ubiquinone/menaquinone biosynthesis C-methylase UbiE